MAQQTDQAEFENFREAFCAYYGCAPEAFERKAFWKTLNRHALPLAVPIWIFNRGFFHKDFDVIRAFGNARNTREFGTATGEFSTVNRMDNNIRRGLLKDRKSVV